MLLIYYQSNFSNLFKPSYVGSALLLDGGSTVCGIDDAEPSC
jgi:hypothetical protein